jgi:hypothetical protein
VQLEFQGLISCMGFRELSFVALLVGNKACCLASSVVTHGATEAVGPTYTGMFVFLAFQGEGNRSCTGGNVELQVPVRTMQQDLQLSNGAWRCAASLGMRHREC